MLACFETLLVLFTQAQVEATEKILSAEQASNKAQRQELAQELSGELDSVKAQLSETLGALESERALSFELRQQLDSIKSEYIISGDLLEAEQMATMALKKSLGELEKKVEQLGSSNASLKEQVGGEGGKRRLEVLMAVVGIALRRCIV